MPGMRVGPVHRLPLLRNLSAGGSAFRQTMKVLPCSLLKATQALRRRQQRVGGP